MKIGAVRKGLVAALALATLGAAYVPAAQAAKLTIVNLDTGLRRGLDDSASVRPVGGNPGRTLGEQRLNALQKAADLWGAGLSSEVEILIDATFMPLACQETSAFLGAAGPTVVEANFPNAPLRDTWYPIALASKLARVDLDPPLPAGLAGDDIVAYFNSAIGSKGCLKGASWYYGLDGRAGADQIDFVAVALHELSHGLGAISFVNLGTGQNLGPNQLNDVWNHHLKDSGTGLLWSQMTSEQRKASATGDKLVWAGPQVVAQSGDLVRGRDAEGMVRMFSPNPARQGSSVSHFDTSVKPEVLGQPMLTGSGHDLGIAQAQLEDIGWTTNLCGNGRIEHNELCDTRSLPREAACQTQTGFNIGTLGCNSSCDGFDTRRCFFVPPDASLADLKLVTMPESHYMVRTIKGGYSAHPRAIVELNKLAIYHAGVRDSRSGPVTGLYNTDPALVSSVDLEWEIGFPMTEGADSSFVTSLDGYKVKTLPAHEVLVVESSVADAPFDGMRILLWLQRNGYSYSSPVRMEFYPPPGKAEATSLNEEQAHAVEADDPSLAAESKTKIIVPVSRTTSGEASGDASR
jgi:hypothetical protein